MKQFSIVPPGGVAINQWKDGSIHFHLGPNQVAPLKNVLQTLLEQLQQYAITTVETQKQKELQRGVLPPSRIQMLEQELDQLRAEAQTIVTEGPSIE